MFQDLLTDLEILWYPIFTQIDDKLYTYQIIYISYIRLIFPLTSLGYFIIIPLPPHDGWCPHSQTHPWDRTPVGSTTRERHRNHCQATTGSLGHCLIFTRKWYRWWWDSGKSAETSETSFREKVKAVLGLLVFLLSWYLFRHWLLRAWLATVPRTQLSQESWKSTGLVSGPNETLSVVSQALTSAGGIDYMHSKSVMHRDIKAENVLLTEWSATAVATRLRFWWCAKWRAQDELDGVRTFEE